MGPKHKIVQGVCPDTPRTEGGIYMNNITSFEQLPVTLKADEVAAVLGISRANAYTLMRSDGFPTIHIGKRMIVPRDKLIEWIDAQVSV